jgi:hypothetical protein
VEPSSGIAHQLGQPSLDRGVDVLVTGNEAERPILHLSGNRVETRQDRLGVGDGNDALRTQHAGVGP